MTHTIHSVYIKYGSVVLHKKMYKSDTRNLLNRLPGYKCDFRPHTHASLPPPTSKVAQYIK